MRSRLLRNHRATLLGLLAGFMPISWSLYGCSMDTPEPGVTAEAKAASIPNTLRVTTTQDGHDALPGDGVCEMNSNSGDCSLRAAIEEANAIGGQLASMRIEIDPGTYVLAPNKSADAPGIDGLIVDVGTTHLHLHAKPNTVAVVGSDIETVFAITSGTVVLEGFSIVGSLSAGVHSLAGAHTTILRSSVIGHVGAGVRVDQNSTVIMKNSTVGENKTGVHNQGTLSVWFSTITRNIEYGLLNNGAVELRATIVAEQGQGSDCNNTVTSLNFNTDSDGSCGFSKPGDSTSSDTNLVKTEYEQGSYYMPTTLSSVVDSIDANSNVCAKSASNDQRGVQRPLGGACDRGAIETGYVTVEERSYKTPRRQPFAESWSECSQEWPEEYGPLGTNEDGHLRIAEPFKPPVRSDQGKHLPGVGCAWRQYHADLSRDVQVEILWSGIRPFEGTPLLHITPGTQKLGVGAWPAHAMPGLTKNVVLLAGTIGNPPETFAVLPDGIIGFRHIEGTRRKIAIRSSGKQFRIWGSHLNTGYMRPYGKAFDIPEELVGSSQHGLALDTHFATPQWPTAKDARRPPIPVDIGADGPVILDYRISKFHRE